jgi:hypothetical protein
MSMWKMGEKSERGEVGMGKMAEGKCRERSLMKKGIETTSSEERWESG